MDNEQNNAQPTEYKLLIEFVYERKRRFLKRMRYLVQNQPFRFGLRIKNIDTKDTPEGKIKNLSLKSGEGGTIENGRDEEFSFPKLNPGHEITLWWPDALTTIIQGQSWVECTVEPSDRNKTKFITYQFDQACNKEFRYSASNRWGDALSIRGELEQQQARTNFLMFILTLLVFLDGVWGLNIIFKTIFQGFGWLFESIGLLLNKLSS